jgi:hypothetical protein
MLNASLQASATLESQDWRMTMKDDALLRLAAALSACEARCAASDEICEEESETHFALRRAIGTIRATTIAGLRVKAEATELAAQLDDDFFLCEGEGYFVELCRSINRDILSLAESGQSAGAIAEAAA